MHAIVFDDLAFISEGFALMRTEKFYRFRRAEARVKPAEMVDIGLDSKEFMILVGGGESVAIGPIISWCVRERGESMLVMVKGVIAEATPESLIGQSVILFICWNGDVDNPEGKIFALTKGLLFFGRITEIIEADNGMHE